MCSYEKVCNVNNFEAQLFITTFKKTVDIYKHLSESFKPKSNYKLKSNSY